jgi:hypothetical protein
MPGDKPKSALHLTRLNDYAYDPQIHKGGDGGEGDNE